MNWLPSSTAVQSNDQVYAHKLIQLKDFSEYEKMEFRILPLIYKSYLCLLTTVSNV